jgi:hypothetical protein
MNCIHRSDGAAHMEKCVGTSQIQGSCAQSHRDPDLSMTLLCRATVISKKRVCNQSIMAWMVLAPEPTLHTAVAAVELHITGQRFQM